MRGRPAAGTGLAWKLRRRDPLLALVALALLRNDWRNWHAADDCARISATVDLNPRGTSEGKNGVKSGDYSYGHCVIEG